jgi:ATP-dependent exoDNAse (exonuclease V) alpha subunit
MPLVMQHYMMLQRNLLYTAITRARAAVRAGGQQKGDRDRGAKQPRSTALDSARLAAETGKTS